MLEGGDTEYMNFFLAGYNAVLMDHNAHIKSEWLAETIFSALCAPCFGNSVEECRWIPCADEATKRAPRFIST